MHVHPVHGSDKGVHLLMYFVLYLLWYAAGFDGLGLFVTLFLLGAGMEILQEILPVHRSGDWWDGAANTGGLLIAWLITTLRKR